MADTLSETCDVADGVSDSVQTKRRRIAPQRLGLEPEPKATAKHLDACRIQAPKSPAIDSLPLLPALKEDDFDLEILFSGSWIHEIRCGPPPPRFRRLKQNLYSDPALRPSRDREAQPSCHCKPATGCDGNCINRSLFMECTPGRCPTLQNDQLHCANMAIQQRKYAGTEVFKTEDRGWGLRTTEPVKRGTLIIEYMGEVVTMDEIERRTQQYSADQDFYFASLDGPLVLDAGPMGSDARFANHSCAPNSALQKWYVAGEPHIMLVALRDLDRGEEVLYCYGVDDTAQKASIFGEQPCRCGAPNCSGLLGKKPEGSALTPMQEWLDRAKWTIETKGSALQAIEGLCEEAEAEHWEAGATAGALAILRARRDGAREWLAKWAALSGAGQGQEALKSDRDDVTLTVPQDAAGDRKGRGHSTQISRNHRLIDYEELHDLLAALPKDIRFPEATEARNLFTRARQARGALRILIESGVKGFGKGPAEKEPEKVRRFFGRKPKRKTGPGKKFRTAGERATDSPAMSLTAEADERGVKDESQRRDLATCLEDSMLAEGTDLQQQSRDDADIATTASSTTSIPANLGMNIPNAAQTSETTAIALSNFLSDVDSPADWHPASLTMREVTDLFRQAVDILPVRLKGLGHVIKVWRQVEAWAARACKVMGFGKPGEQRRSRKGKVDVARQIRELGEWYRGSEGIHFDEEQCNWVVLLESRLADIVEDVIDREEAREGKEDRNVEEGKVKGEDEVGQGKVNDKGKASKVKAEEELTVAGPRERRSVKPIIKPEAAQVPERKVVERKEPGREKDKELRCLCRLPERESKMQVLTQCEECQEWYHPACVNLTTSEVESLDTFLCPICRHHQGYPSELAFPTANQLQFIEGSQRLPIETVRDLFQEAQQLPLYQVDYLPFLGCLVETAEKWEMNVRAALSRYDSTDIMRPISAAERCTNSPPSIHVSTVNASPDTSHCKTAACEILSGSIPTSETRTPRAEPRGAELVTRAAKKAFSASARILQHLAGLLCEHHLLEVSISSSLLQQLKSLIWRMVAPLCLNHGVSAEQDGSYAALATQEERQKRRRQLFTRTSFDTLLIVLTQGENLGLQGVAEYRKLAQVMQHAGVWLEHVSSVDLLHLSDTVNPPPCENKLDYHSEWAYARARAAVLMRLKQKGVIGPNAPSPPQTHAPTSSDQTFTWAIDLDPHSEQYCLCRGPDCGEMINCDGCQEWFHYDCVGYRPPNRRRAKSRGTQSRPLGTEELDDAPDYFCIACCEANGKPYPFKWTSLTSRKLFGGHDSAMGADDVPEQIRPTKRKNGCVSGAKGAKRARSRKAPLCVAEDDDTATSASSKPLKRKHWSLTGLSSPKRSASRGHGLSPDFPPAQQQLNQGTIGEPPHGDLPEVGDSSVPDSNQPVLQKVQQQQRQQIEQDMYVLQEAAEAAPFTQSLPQQAFASLWDHLQQMHKQQNAQTACQEQQFPSPLGTPQPDPPEMGVEGQVQFRNAIAPAHLSPADLFMHL